MSIEDVVSGAEGALNTKSVYGEIYEKNGTAILPVAKIMGGAGGGEGEDEGHPENSGSGSGFGIRAKPTGVYAIRDDSVVWKPALDWNRIILGGQIVGIVALFALRSIVKIRAKTRSAERKQVRGAIDR